jgi:hypothetical protein
MIFNPLRVPKNRSFEYRPMYYDAEKEEFEERIKQAKLNAGIKIEGDHQSIMKGQLRRKFNRSSKRRAKRQSNIRLIIIILALIGIAYYLFYF